MSNLLSLDVGLRSFLVWGVTLGHVGWDDRVVTVDELALIHCWTLWVMYGSVGLFAPLYSTPTRALESLYDCSDHPQLRLFLDPVVYGKG